jgi:hypothetical protein
MTGPALCSGDGSGMGLPSRTRGSVSVLPCSVTALAAATAVPVRARLLDNMKLRRAESKRSMKASGGERLVAAMLSANGPHGSKCWATAKLMGYGSEQLGRVVS